MSEGFSGGAICGPTRYMIWQQPGNSGRSKLDKILGSSKVCIIAIYLIICTYIVAVRKRLMTGKLDPIKYHALKEGPFPDGVVNMKVHSLQGHCVFWSSETAGHIIGRLQPFCNIKK